MKKILASVFLLSLAAPALADEGYSELPQRDCGHCETTNKVMPTERMEIKKITDDKDLPVYREVLVEDAPVRYAPKPQVQHHHVAPTPAPARREPVNVNVTVQSSNDGYGPEVLELRRQVALLQAQNKKLLEEKELRDLKLQMMTIKLEDSDEVVERKLKRVERYSSEKYINQTIVVREKKTSWPKFYIGPTLGYGPRGLTSDDNDVQTETQQDYGFVYGGIGTIAWEKAAIGFTGTNTKNYLLNLQINPAAIFGK